MKCYVLTSHYMYYIQAVKSSPDYLVTDHAFIALYPLLTLQAKRMSSIAWARIYWRRHSKVTMAASLRMDRQVKNSLIERRYQTGYFYDTEINC